MASTAAGPLAEGGDDKAEAAAAAAAAAMGKKAEGQGQNAAVPEVLQPGQVVQDFEIVRPLGKGKFSIVYMAKRLSDSTMCALKKINIFDMMAPKQREKCMKEVKLLQSLDHPNIVKFLSSFVDNHELLIIVEWAEKGDLKRLLRRAQQNDVRFKDIELWEYSRQLASALDHMHGRRIMHRDLKPANIFVATDGSLKLGDLGLGRFFSSQTLEAFSKVGTPLYMSPEVLQGAGYDMRSDVWSLGCVLYELAALKSPFKSDQQLSLYDLFVRISKGQYPPLEEKVNADFRSLVDRMLQLDPRRRPDCGKVFEHCVAQSKAVSAPSLSKSQSSSAAPRAARPSPLLVMDDIIEKLKLLECEEYFLTPRGWPLLHHCVFALPCVLPDHLSQFELMYELALWLMGMLQARDTKNGVPQASKADTQRPLQAALAAEEEAERLRRLTAELSGRGIQVTSETTLAQLRQGYGEGVCLILNELINQELVARDFHFGSPAWHVRAEDQPQDEVAEVDEELGLSCGEMEDEDDETKYEELMPKMGVPHTGDGEFGPYAVDPVCIEGSAYEPVFDAPHINPEAWNAELERVRPLLRGACPRMEGGWRVSLSQARDLARALASSTELARAPQALESCRRQWRCELDRLRAHEESLHSQFGARCEEAARMRSATALEAERVEVLQKRVSKLSKCLASVEMEAERAREEIGSHNEALLDFDALPKMRKAMLRLREESGQLELRARCIQRELFWQSTPAAPR